MFSGKKNKEGQDNRDADDNRVYLVSHQSSGDDFSSGMSGGFSADSKEEYEAAKVKQPALVTPSPPDTRDFSLAPQGRQERTYSPESSSIAMEFKKLNAKIESIVGWIRSFYDSFSKAIERINRINADLEEDREKVKRMQGKVDSKHEEWSNVLKDVDDLKKRAEVFIGTEELLKLHDEVKKNLDKIMQRSGAPRDQRRNIPIDLLEKTAILAKQNKEAIGTFTFEDYEEKIDSILKVVENLADQVSELKEKVESSGNRDVEFKPINEKGSSKKDRNSRESSAREFLEDIGEVPELPELPTDRIKKIKKSRRRK